MRIKARSAFTFILAFILAGSFLVLPGYATGAQGILSLTAEYSNNSVSVSGTASSDILAVALLVYDTDETTLLRMETVGVTLRGNENAFSGTVQIPLSAGTYTVKAANYEGGDFATATFTVSAPASEEDDDDDSRSSSSPTPVVVTPAPAAVYHAKVTTGTNQIETLTITQDATGENAVTSLETETVQALFSGEKNPVITLPAIPGVTTYTLELPASSLTQSESTGTLAFSTNTGTLTVPDNMLSVLSEMENKKVGLSIGQGDKDTLSDNEKDAVGNRPLIKLQLTVDGTQTQWNNPDAPVSLSIPYTPTEAELENPESIVIWYLDGSGNLVCIPNGKYNPYIGEVTFTTTHFSLYAVGYNPMLFSDVNIGAWYQKAVAFIAARGITQGTGEGKFSPEALLTRGEFIVLLMRSYGIEPDDNPADNFTDAGNTYYTGYLAAAKRLGMTHGVGNNLYAPDRNISRQEMFTLIFNALEAINRLPKDTSDKTLASFEDADSIAAWAKEAISQLVEYGAIRGSNNRLYPQNTSSRAEMAQILYNILLK